MECYDVSLLNRTRQTNVCLEVVINTSDAAKSRKELIKEKIKEEIKRDRDIYQVLSVKRISTCWGCRAECMGQRDHMDVGGCLYDPENPYY